jgi:glutathione reductase (NADPH)
MKKQFDLVVIGTGAAGSAPAYKCRAAGWQVAVIDELPYGGTCALRGCDPKKVLVGAGELTDWSRRMHAHGVSGDLQIGWSELIQFKQSFTEPVPAQREESLKAKGIETFHGPATFVDRTTVQVGDSFLTGRYFHIATGAKPAKLNVSGEDLLTTSTQFLDLPQLPHRILFVGGGYISFEFSHVAARAGAEARILHRGPTPLAGFDPDLVQQLVEATRAAGIDVRLNSPVRAIHRNSDGFIVEAGTGDSPTFEADLVVHGAGRAPAIDSLDLQAAGVRYGVNGVTVNEHLQSVSNNSVYAAGDAADSPGLPLTPVAAMEGYVVAANLLKGNSRTAEYRSMPSVVFALPPLAMVGMLEAEARSKGLRFKVNTAETSQWYSSRRVAERVSSYKILIEEDTDRILGAHLLGKDAEEVINVFALAIQSDIKAATLRHMLFSYPSRCSDIPYML